MSAERFGPYRAASTRLPTWDYSWEASYFVTICTADRRPHFDLASRLRHGRRCAGDIAFEHMVRLPRRFPALRIAAGVVMPDHVHLLVELRHEDSASDRPPPRRFGPPVAGALSTYVNLYKGVVTRTVRRRVDPSFGWQAGFHDRIVRDENEFNAKVGYILRNPVLAGLVEHPWEWPYVAAPVFDC